jgi:hypothetical protein
VSESRPTPGETETETVTEPAKLIRVASMAHQVLEELHYGNFGDAARARVDTAYKDSLAELRGVLSDDLRRELERLAAPLEQGGGPPPESELRVAEAQLTGWLEGLIEGVQASVANQQVAAQLAQAQQRQQAQRERQQPQPPTPQDRHRYR